MRIRILAAAAVLCLFALSPPGCESSESVRAAREVAVAEKAALDESAAKATAAIERMNLTLSDLQAEKKRLSELAATLDPGSVERTATEKTIANLVERLGVLDKSLGEANAAVELAKTTSAELGRRVETADRILAGTAPGTPNAGTDLGTLLGMFIPGAATMAPVIGGLVYRGARLARAKKTLQGEVSKKTTALDRIVASIDALAEIAPEVKSALSKHASVIDTIQTPIGKIEVDGAQSRNATPLATAA